MALTHFKEPLSHRKGLSFTFTNVAMSDADVDVLAEIIEANDSVVSVSLCQNLITAKVYMISHARTSPKTQHVSFSFA